MGRLKGFCDTILWLGLRHTSWHSQKDWHRALVPAVEAVEKYLGSLSSRGMEEGLLKALHAKVEGLMGVHIPHG